ncbi:class I SAM-dependent DNA methyltransferase [Marinobacter sp. JSM 1782161]|uniref:class I SAM-dependent DNA methyltransferase n=1 Tax=Marinobacter sp. JSM 1782161 TaxID=2685906 RepID=UPI001401E46A|nr:class I SAM-dependent methyltransferase [Marinobacter sp. JSM 1782161]
MGRRQILESAITAKSPEALGDLYSQWAGSYDNDLLNEMGYKAPATTASIFQQFHTDKAGTILDVGCGTGIVGALLSDSGYPAIEGLDYSDAMLDEAKKKGVYRELFQADLNKTLTVANDRYSALISVGTFTFAHVGPEALHELIRITTPGGIICFTVRSEAWNEHGYKGFTEDLEAQGKWALLDRQTIDYIEEEHSTCEVLVYRVS